MKKLLYIASAFIALATLWGCAETNGPEAPAEGGLIRFTASVGQYTKATDTGFEEGDKIGLYAGTPLNLVNIPLTYSRNALTSEQELRWGDGQTAKTTFRAYYPYFAQMESQPEVIPFIVKKNQSQHKDYTVSDLMFATTEASPADESVKLQFNHLLSKLILEIENQTTDPVKEVLIGGPLCGSLVNRITGEVGAATANPDESGHDDEVIFTPFMEQTTALTQCSLILPPQKATVDVAVLTMSGRICGFEAKQVNFVSGKTLKGTLTIKSVPVGDQTEFTLSIEDWIDGGNLSFSDKQPGNRTGWNICYYPSPNYYLETIPMEEVTAGAFYGVIKDYRSDYNAYTRRGGVLLDEFYFVSNNDRYIFGNHLKTPQNIWDQKEWPVTNGGYFVASEYSGPLGIWFYPDLGIMEYEPITPKWKKLGTGEFVNTFYNWSLADAKIYGVDIYEDQDRPGVYMVENAFNQQDWDTDFYFNGPYEMIIDASDPEKVILRPIAFYPGDEYGEVFYTNVPGNRWAREEEVYGSLENGVIRFPSLCGYSRKGGRGTYNSSGIQIVLPGYQRNPLVGFNYYDIDQWETIDGANCAVFELQPWVDVDVIRYMAFPGVVDYNTLSNEVRSRMFSGEGTAIEFTPGRTSYFYVPIAQSGSYTLAFYGESTSTGKTVYYTSTHTFILPDGSMPESHFALSGAKPHDLFPDKAAIVHLDLANGTTYGVRAVTTAAAQAAGLSENDYYQFAMSGPYMSYQGSFFNSIDGQDIAVVGLEPSTEYLIIAAGKDIFGRTMTHSTTVTTSAAPTSWTNVGTGTWYDAASLRTNAPYSAEVQIQQVQGTQRYRVVQPYASFWANGANANVYFGSSSDFEFALKTVDGVSYIIYLPTRTGYCVPDYAQAGTDSGCLTLMHYDPAVKNPGKHIYTEMNKAIADGVYNIAPYIAVTGTSQYLSYMRSNGTFILTMPGAAAAVAPVGTQAPIVSNDKDVPAPAVIFGESKVSFRK